MTMKPFKKDFKNHHFGKKQLILGKVLKLKGPDDFPIAHFKTKFDVKTVSNFKNYEPITV